MKTPPLFFIGSLPYQSPAEAINFVKRYSAHLPFLPQLPEANPEEDMVGQVLRGFEEGRWDGMASCCFEPFLREFGRSPRVKIQIAGPFTVARAISGSYQELLPPWLSLLRSIVGQMHNAGALGEIWVQVDEPSWTAKSPLPASYAEVLKTIRGMREKIRVGIHSCATPRPQFASAIWLETDFLSFDFTVPPTELEREQWTRVSSANLAVVAGVLAKGAPISTEHISALVPPSEALWVSAPCGLYGWSPEEINSTFGDSEKSLSL